METTHLLQTYRDFMARMGQDSNPDPQFWRESYVLRQNFNIGDIATRLLLEPTSTHLLVGGSGSGKTTELLLACHIINQQKNTKAIYIDVGQKLPLDRLNEGSLITLMGLEFANLLDPKQFPNAHKAAQDLKTLAERKPTPKDRKTDLVMSLLPALITLTEAVKTTTPHIVVCFDSLDRIHNPSLFLQVLFKDLAALKYLQIGFLATSSLPRWHKGEAMIAPRFDTYSHLLDIDTTHDKQGCEFLLKVLRARQSSTLLPDETCAALVEMSGGILRHLLTLARQAGQYAFMADAPHINLTHVQMAVEVQRNKLLFGIPAESESLRVLTSLAKGQRLLPRTNQDMDLIQSLLQDRQIIDYQTQTPITYTVHPVIAKSHRPNGTEVR